MHYEIEANPSGFGDPGNWIWCVKMNGTVTATFGGPCALSAAYAFIHARQTGALGDGWVERATRYIKGVVAPR